MNHTFISPVCYVDVSAVCVCAVHLEVVCLLIVCRQCRVHRSERLGLIAFRLWRAGIGGVGRALSTCAPDGHLQV